MKVVFAGPSVYGADIDWGDIDVRVPAKCGDLLAAVRDGATVIGLIDGFFEGGVAIWHKEILHALSSGVKVFGASSMGALRAAECFDFGMQPVGKIAEAYVSGELTADADVAVQHGPVELGCPPVTLAMVDVRATLERLHQSGQIDAAQHRDIAEAAENLFFKQRNAGAIFARIDGGPDLIDLFTSNYFSQKTVDARLLIEMVRNEPDELQNLSDSWSFQQSPQWQALATQSPPAVAN